MTAITPEIVAEHGLNPEEYERVKAHMGREPNLVELGVFRLCGRSIALISPRGGT